MATSKCPKCGATEFEVKTIKPNGVSYKVELLQCAVCGAVLGALNTEVLGTHIVRGVETTIESIKK